MKYAFPQIIKIVKKLQFRHTGENLDGNIPIFLRNATKYLWFHHAKY